MCACASANNMNNNTNKKKQYLTCKLRANYEKERGRSGITRETKQKEGK